MKLLTQIFILLFILFFPKNLFSQWENIGGPEKGQVDEFLYEDGITYAVSRHAIHYSTDEGETWKYIQGSNAMPYLIKVKIDKGQIYALANSAAQENGQSTYARLFRLSKIGEKWEQLFSNYKINNPVDFAVKSDTVALVTHDSIYVSTDGGNKIVSKSYRNYDDIYAVPFAITIHKKEIYYNDFDGIYKSTDLVNFSKVVNINFIRYFLPTDDKLLVLTQGNEKIIVGDSFALVNKVLLRELVNDSLIVKTDLSNFTNFTSKGKCLHNRNTPYFLTFNCDSLLYIDNTTQKWDTKSLGIPHKDNEGLFSYKGVRFNWINNNMYYSYNRANFRSIDNGDTFIPMHNGLVTDANELTAYKNTVLGDKYTLTKYDNATAKWINLAMGDEKSFAVSNEKLYVIKDEGLIEIDEFGSKVRDVIPANSQVREVYAANKLLIVRSSIATFRSSIDNGETWSNFNSIISYDFNFGVRYINEKYLIWSKQIFAYSDDALQWTTVKSNFFYKPDYILDVVYDPANKFYVRDYDSILELNPSNIEQVLFVYPPFYKNSSDYTITSMDMYANVLFLSIVNKGIYYRTDNGFWNALNDGLETFAVNDIEIVQDKIYVGASAFVYRINLADLNVELKTGEVFHDKNKNGKKDAGEVGSRNIDLQNTNGELLGSTNHEGIFSFFDLKSGSDSVMIRSSPYYQSTNGPFALNTNSFIQLGIDAINKYDVSIDLATTAMRPGFSSVLTIVAEDLIQYDSPVGRIKLQCPQGIKIGNIIPEPSFKNGAYIEWDFYPEFDTFPFIAFLEFVVDSNTPIDDELCFTGKIELWDQEINLSNNTDTHCALVVGSYDPNDKQVDASSQIKENEVDKHAPLAYTIRFQNTGNYKAEYVKILDTLSSNVDVNSFRLMASSHAVYYKIRGNVVEFKFDNIDLPDSMSNQLLSHGFVKYSVQLKKGLNVGDAIDNTAYIYFDYNAPIKTNTVGIVIDKSNGTIEANLINFNVYPNPVKDLLYIQTEIPITEINTIEIYNSQGQLILRKVNNSLSQGINVTTMPNGLYHIVLVMKNGEMLSRKFIVGR